MTAVEAYIKTLQRRFEERAWISSEDAELLDIINSIQHQVTYRVDTNVYAQPSERNKRILKQLGYIVEYSSISWKNFGMEDLI